MPYTLIYFPVRGRAMHIRYLCLDNDIPFDIEVVLGSDWPAVKPTMPFGQLPVLKDGNFEVSQSNAILRYLARKHGLYGSNDQEASLIDMINDQQEDIRTGYARLIYRDYETGKEAYIANLPSSMALFENVLATNNGGDGFFVGSKISFVDYTLFDLFDNHLILSPSCLDNCPKLRAFYSRMAARPKLAAYRQTEEFKAMKINGNDNK